MRSLCLILLAALSIVCGIERPVHAQDRIMGQIQFVTSSKIVKSSGVWVDGEYVGYLGELKGSNRLRLLPGEHEITARQAGYEDYRQTVTVEPRMVTDVRVVMEKDGRFRYPDPRTSSEIRFDVQPSRAAVFLDDNYVGTVSDYYGFEHGMLVAPGKHRFKIALAGFKAFETEMTLFPRQKFAIRTDLVEGSIRDADPSIRTESNAAPAGVEGSPRAAR